MDKVSNGMAILSSNTRQVKNYIKSDYFTNSETLLIC